MFWMAISGVLGIVVFVLLGKLKKLEVRIRMLETGELGRPHGLEPKPSFGQRALVAIAFGSATVALFAVAAQVIGALSAK